MEIRPLAGTDIEACVDVLYESDDDLTRGLNLPPQPRNPDRLATMFRHVAASTSGRSWVAEESGRVVAFGMAVDRDDVTFLSFLFVLPEHQGRGLGRALYARCMAGGAAKATCIWSVQPVSAALYAADGLVPRSPVYTFLGRPRHELPRVAAGMGLTAIDQWEIDALDREVVGLTRAADHRAWQGWDRRPFALRDGSDIVGYGYAQPSGRLGPVVVRDERHLLPFVGTLMAQVEPAGDWMIHVPGPAATTFAALLTAGLKFDGAPTIYCATDARTDYSRYVPGSFALP